MGLYWALLPEFFLEYFISVVGKPASWIHEDWGKLTYVKDG